MENENCSWVTRAKFSPNTYIRSGLSRSPSIRWDCQSDRLLDLKKESLISKSMSRDFSFVQLSEANPLASSTRKTDGKSGRNMKDSSFVSSDSVSCKSSLQRDTMKLYSYAVWFASCKKKLDQMKRKSKPNKRSISPLPTLSTGRPIQVESSYGEHLPSVDTRPPWFRDLDAVI